MVDTSLINMDNMDILLVGKSMILELFPLPTSGKINVIAIGLLYIFESSLNMF